MMRWFTIRRGCDDPRRADPEDPLAEATQTAELEDDRRRDKQRLADLCHGGADGPDEAPPGAGRARRHAVRAHPGGNAAAPGSALSRLVAGRGAERPAHLPLLRAGTGLRHDLEGADPGG